MNRFVPGLRLLLSGMVLLTVALLPLAVSAQGKTPKRPDRYVVSPPKGEPWTALKSQIDFYNKGNKISENIFFYPAIYAPYNLAYSRAQPTWHSKYDIELLNKKKLSWSVEFSADGQLSNSHRAFRRNYRSRTDKNGKKTFFNTPEWKVGYPQIQYKPRNLKIYEGSTKNFRSTWKYEIRPGKGDPAHRRWQVMYEIRLALYDQASKKFIKPVWIQIELVKQGHGERPAGTPVVIRGNDFSEWYLDKFGSAWTKKGDEVPVQRFSYITSYDPIGTRKDQNLVINFFPFLQYCAGKNLLGVTWDHQITEVNAGIEIGRGGRGTKFTTLYYGIGVWDKPNTKKKSGSPASGTREVSPQMAAMREQQTRVPTAVGAL